MAELDALRGAISSERKLHQDSLKYTSLELLVLKKRRYDAQQAQKSQAEVRRLTDLNRKLRASLIQMRDRFHELESRSREELFELSPEMSREELQ